MAVGDDARLRQVLANLLRNAGVHTPEGTRVWVSLTKEGGEAVISVADNGPGIPPDAQAQIFERFGRIDESRARITGGTGLGLAIAQSIVLAHGGTIAVGETPGGGATFTVRLPLHA
jgi:two-component system OmpR family sensor kinase